MSRATPKDHVAAMRMLCRTMDVARVAEIFNVSPMTVYRVRGIVSHEERRAKRLRDRKVSPPVPSSAQHSAPKL